MHTKAVKAGIRRFILKKKILRFVINHIHHISWFAAGLYVLVMGRITRLQFMAIWLMLMWTMWCFMPNTDDEWDEFLIKEVKRHEKR